MPDSYQTRIARSRQEDPRNIVEEIVGQLGPEPPEMLLYFAASSGSFEQLARLLHEAYGSPSMGCTTAGELCTSEGHCEQSVVALAIRNPSVEFRTRLIHDAGSFDAERAEEAVRPMLEPGPLGPDAKQFGLVLVDGLSMAEEQVCGALANALGSTPFVGGSAGDDLRFEKTLVACNGEVAENAAVLGVVHSLAPFHVFHSHHFEPTDDRLVITRAIASERRVLEVNGQSAAQGYANAVGLEIDELSPQIFAAHPVLLSIGGNYYVRSIQKVNDDGSLTFFCAIDEGLVLRVAKPLDLPSKLAEEVSHMQETMGEIDAVIGFDCILRRLELLGKNQRDVVHETLSKIPIAGFSTYGEQYNGLHVNQTLTGVAIGKHAA